MKNKTKNEAANSEARQVDALVSRKAPAKDLAEACRIGESNTFNPGYVFSEEEFKYFCSKLLEEQRELCYENHWDESCRLQGEYFEDEIRDAIIDAPEPRL